MREFGTPVGADERKQILEAARWFYSAVEPKRAVAAREFAMEEEPDRIVVHEAEWRWDGGRMRVAATQASARPPFEWLFEITSDVGEADYFKHYLIRDNDVVLAQRKILTPVDAQETRLILHDLQLAKDALAASDVTGK